eukprot:COSAG01_NODE_973_length_12368_cov_12.435732_9_plen_39_part_00
MGKREVAALEGILYGGALAMDQAGPARATTVPSLRCGC